MSALDIKMTVNIDGTEYLGEQGTIEDTWIGFEDHGIFSWNIDFAFGGSGQGTGHRFLEETALKTIQEIITVAGVRRWESLKGTPLVVLREEPRGFIKGLANAQTGKHVIF